MSEFRNMPIKTVFFIEDRGIELIKKISSIVGVNKKNVNNILTLVFENKEKMNLDQFDFMVLCCLLSAYFAYGLRNFRANDLLKILRGNVLARFPNTSTKKQTLNKQLIDSSIHKFICIKIISIDEIKINKNILSLKQDGDFYCYTESPVLLDLFEKLVIAIKGYNYDVFYLSGLKKKIHDTKYTCKFKYFVMMKLAFLDNKVIISTDTIKKLLNYNERLNELKNSLNSRKINYSIYEKRAKRLYQSGYIEILYGYLNYLKSKKILKSYKLTSKELTIFIK